MQIRENAGNVQTTLGDHSTKNLMDEINDEDGENILDRLAGENSLAIVVVDESSSVVSASNNNSMCRALYSSEKFAPLCDEFCGKAFAWASASEAPVEYECYAGLKCSAARVESSRKPLVAIVGRAFLNAENYRKATGRAIAGDWQEFPPSKFFENVLLSSSDKKIKKLVKKVANLREAESRTFLALDKENPIELPAEKTPANKTETDPQLGDLIREFQKNETAEPEVKPAEIMIETKVNTAEIKIWRSFFGSLLEMKYNRALASILDFISTRYGFTSLAWLERKNNHLEVISTCGRLQNEQFRISLPADDRRLVNAVQNETSLELREKNPSGEAESRRTIQFFPVAVGEQVRAALVIGEKITDEK